MRGINMMAMLICLSRLNIKSDETVATGIMTEEVDSRSTASMMHGTLTMIN